MGRNLAACTFPEFLGRRYQSALIQQAGGLIIFLSMPLYAAVVLIGSARFIEQTLSVQFEIALFMFSAIVASYVVAGGLKGVMYTDALQGTIMFTGMVFLAGATYAKLGGVYAAHTALTNMAHLVPEELQAIGHLGWTALPATGSVWWWTLFSTIILGVGIGVLAQPQLIVRFMTVKSDKELNRAVLVGGIFILAMVGVVYVVGALSNVFFYRESGDIAIAAAQGNHDLIFPLFINKAMPSWFVYIFMLSLLSAAMSTISSQFHAMGSSIGRDFFENIRKTRFDTVIITKIGIVIAIIVSMIIGYRLPGSVIAQGTAIFFSICAATFLPAYFSGLYWKKATRAGALASILTGVIASLFCLLFLHAKEADALGICKLIFGRTPLVTTHPWPVVDPILIALPLSIAVMIVVSLLTERLPHEHVEECFA
jgi:SSS family solute:Na+ symporter